MKLRILTVAMLALAGIFASCQSQRHPYKGYKKSPYTIKGHRFVPMDVHPALSYKAEGIASFYDGSGGVNAIGERLRSGEYYAAHRTLPLPCTVRITSLANGNPLTACLGVKLSVCLQNHTYSIGVTAFSGQCIHIGWLWYT